MEENKFIGVKVSVEESTNRPKFWRAVLIQTRWSDNNRPNLFQRFWGWDIFFEKIPMFKTMILVNVLTSLLFSILF